LPLEIFKLYSNLKHNIHVLNNSSHSTSNTCQVYNYTVMDILCRTGIFYPIDYGLLNYGLFFTVSYGTAMLVQYEKGTLACVSNTQLRLVSWPCPCVICSRGSALTTRYNYGNINRNPNVYTPEIKVKQLIKMLTVDKYHIIIAKFWFTADKMTHYLLRGYQSLCDKSLWGVASADFGVLNFKRANITYVNRTGHERIYGHRWHWLEQGQQ